MSDDHVHFLNMPNQVSCWTLNVLRYISTNGSFRVCPGKENGRRRLGFGRTGRGGFRATGRLHRARRRRQAQHEQCRRQQSRDVPTEEFGLKVEPGVVRRPRRLEQRLHTPRHAIRPFGRRHLRQGSRPKTRQSQILLEGKLDINRFFFILASSVNVLLHSPPRCTTTAKSFTTSTDTTRPRPTGCDTSIRPTRPSRRTSSPASTR